MCCRGDALEKSALGEPSPGRCKVDAERHSISEETRHRTLVELPKGAGRVERNPLWPPGHDQERYPYEEYGNGKAK